MCGIHQEKRREKLGETRYTHVASYKTSVMEDGLQSVKVDLKKKKNHNAPQIPKAPGESLEPH